MLRSIATLTLAVGLLAGSAVGVAAQGETGPDGLVTEELEPGVVRVISDGAGHDLGDERATYPYDIVDIAVASDGTVWLISADYGTTDEPKEARLVWVLGRQGMTEGAPLGELVPLEDGSLLIVGESVTRFDGQAFLPDHGPNQRSLGGGTLWLLEPAELMTLAEDPGSVEPPEERLAIIWRRGWRSLSEANHGNRYIERCSGGPDGVVCVDRLNDRETRFLEGTHINEVAVTGDGVIWAVGGHAGENGGLYRITPQ